MTRIKNHKQFSQFFQNFLKQLNFIELKFIGRV